MIFQNIISDKPSWTKTPDGFLRCRARVLAERVMPYAKSELADIPNDFSGDTVNMLVTRNSFGTAEALRSLEGVPITIGDHQWLTPELVRDFGKGSVAGTPILDGPYLVCDLMVTDPQAIEAIEGRELPEISAAYTADTVFEPGVFDGQKYDAIQQQLRFNHIAVIPSGHGRAGSDVRILNKGKGVKTMVRVQLKNTGKFVNVEGEEDAKILNEEAEASSAGLEDTMGQLEGKKSEMETLQAEIDELKGELSVYKEKLDELLSEEVIEHAAEEMVKEGNEAEEIIENSPQCAMNEKGEEDEKKFEEIKNSLKGLHGTKLFTAVLNAVGVKTENMSPEALRGAFKAQHQICNALKARIPTRQVVGAKMMNTMGQQSTPGIESVVRSGHERLGFPKK